MRFSIGSVVLLDAEVLQGLERELSEVIRERTTLLEGFERLKTVATYDHLSEEKVRHLTAEIERLSASIHEQGESIGRLVARANHAKKVLNKCRSSDRDAVATVAKAINALEGNF